MQVDIRPTPAGTLGNLQATAGLKSITLTWDLPVTDASYRGAEIWMNTVNDRETGTLLGTFSGNSTNVEVADFGARYFWIRAVNEFGRKDGPFTGPASAGAKKVTNTDAPDFIFDLASQNIINTLSKSKVSGLGALAALNSVNAYTQVTNLGNLAFANAIYADDIGAGTLAAGVIYAGTINAGNIYSGTMTSASINIPSAAGGSLFAVGQYGYTVSYRQLSGYNISSSNLADPYSASIDGRDVSGGGRGYVGYGSYSFYSASGTMGPFTGSHDALLANGLDVIPGDIAVDIACLVRKDVSNTLCSVTVSSQPCQKGVLGVFAAAARPLSDCAPTTLVFEYHPSRPVVDDFGNITHIDQNVYASSYQTLCASYQLVAVNGVGEGQINVCGENGPIAMGDYIVTSSMPGKGMRQDDDIKRSYTVARAREAVNFDTPDQVKQISCIYEAG